MDTKKVFLDTNIIIDLLCHREHCAEAATVVNMGIEGKVLLYKGHRDRYVDSLFHQ